MVAVDWKFVEEISRFGRDDVLLELNHGEPRKKRASARKKERRADGELGKMSWTTGRRRLAGKTGKAPPTDNAWRWRSFERAPPLKASRPLIRVLVINDNGLWINNFI